MRSEEQRKGFILALEYTQEILREPGSWTRDALARDTRGIPTKLESPEATSFCIVGALCLAGARVQTRMGPHSCPITTLGSEVNKSREEHPDGLSLAEWNNEPERTQADIQSALGKTRKRLELED